jgi:hypothetical protein
LLSFVFWISVCWCARFFLLLDSKHSK